ncbi:DUF551 domain-containing protein [Klebsiella pneumoniae]|nr:DUF551 domain-containing protein [Klebsiella pneumoniae]
MSIGDAIIRAAWWNHCRAAMLQENPVCTCPSGDGSLRWPCQVHPGSSPVIPDGSASMLRRWLAFGRGMQNAGSQLPHNLIAETESMLAVAPQPQNAPQNIPEIIPGWIPVSERMPEAGGDMIVFTDGIVMSGVSYAKKKGFYIQALEYDDDEPVDSVTHWMPLPAAPQEVK